MFSWKTYAASVKNTRKKTFLLILAVSLLSMVLMGAMYDSQRKSVSVKVIDDFSGVDMVKTATTRQATVQAFLDELGIGMEETDVISPKLDEAITDGTSIVVRRGRNIILDYDNVYASAVTTRKKVAEFLYNSGITVNPYDIVTPSLDSNLKSGDTISIVRVVREEYKKTEQVAPAEIKVEDSSLYVDETAVRQEGTFGVKEITFAKVYHDGVQVADEYVSEQIITPATDRIIAVGTKARANTHKGFTYKKKITVNASAYEPYNCGGDGRGITASGMKAQFGVVAVDPRVIPLGTKLYIESTDDGASWTYGYAIAADTGGAIKGNRIDLCYNTRGECIQFGRRSANVYVLS